ncbi:SufE protein probably involved in Fe-S center assembly [Synechococcus sp. PCC 7502]|uniref:SufE family protein n=1 Tax=Synechococcus sp. PCC 7502 TaxID=1173263 RepID=UPI00029FD4F2|nr:SufE family protein [Synechococcus sp. PCC 7502]AFY73765.1 SufE protein probably involved in Fe-S center assembly [Synechococcus sp. PCC 7502]
MQSTTAQLPDALDRIIKRFQRLSDPKQRYEQLILYGQKLPKFADSDRTPENKVPGCISQVFITAQLNDQNQVIFTGDSDGLISKGFAGLLISGLNNASPEVILNLAPDFINDTGLIVSLTPSRANGFFSVFKTMQAKVRVLV